MPRAIRLPALDRLVELYGWHVCDDPQSLLSWAGGLGEHMLLLPGDDASDAAEVAADAGPRLARTFGHRFDCALVQTRDDAAMLAITGQTRTPSFVFFRDGRQIGSVSGPMDWPDRVARAKAILDGAPMAEPAPAFA